MGRLVNRLTPKDVKELAKRGRYLDGAGLFLQISKWGTKSWVFRYMLDNSEHHMGLGSADTFTLVEARKRAAQARQLLADGVDPIAARKRRRNEARDARARQLTFKEVAEAHIAFAGDAWKNEKHKAQWTSTFETYAYPIIGNVPVSDIETQDILRILEPIWNRKTETASRVQQRIAAVIDRAIAKNMRSSENPARWKGHLDKLLPARSQVASVEHHAAMPFKNVPAFVTKLQSNSALSARALELTILCASRTAEVIKSSWPEFDLDERVWTIPAERMKAEKEHRIPLSDRAHSILKSLADTNGKEGFVFPGARAGHPLSNMAMLELLRGMVGHGVFTVHGFRSSFRDWAGELTHFPREVIEHALAHQLKDKAEASYARGTLFDKRRDLMAAWALFCQKGPEPEETKAPPAEEQAIAAYPAIESTERQQL